MEIINDRRSREAENNTVLALLENLDLLLLGLGTKRGKFDNPSQKDKIILAIKRIANYRLNEGIIKKGSKIGVILTALLTANFHDLSEIEKLYSSLISASGGIVSERKSEYFTQKKIEENEKKGESILNKFFRFFTS